MSDKRNLWSLWQTAKATHSRPSQWFEDSEGSLDALAGYCLDGTVTLFGLAVESALSETDEVRSQGQTRRKPRYTLKQLLDPTFRLPSPLIDTTVQAGPVAGTGDGALLVDEVD